MKIPRSPLTDYEWYRGNLSWMLRPNGQSWIRDFVRGCAAAPNTVEPIVINAHRRLGKSYLNIVLAVESCLSAPGRNVKYVCGEKEQVRDIVEPLFHQIMETCPPDLYPKHRGFRWSFLNPTWDRQIPSHFHLVGANYKNGDMGRGTACDDAFLDEVRDFKRLKYFHESVLLYQFVGRQCPRLIMTSTVPWSMDHDFTRPVTGYIPRAIVSRRYLEIPGSKNPDFTEKDKQIVLSSIGGDEKSLSYQREVECRLVGDPGRLIVPEYQEHKDVILVDEYQRPEFFIPTIVLDSGFDPDATAILFGYIDFVPQLLVIEAEVVQLRMTTKDIVDAVRDMKEKLEYNKQPHMPLQVADINERGLVDMSRYYKCYFRPAERYNREAALTHLRSRVQQEQVRIVRPKCPQLDYQLLNGIYNEKGNDFERSETLFHWDAGMALAYFNRQAQWRTNPFPKNWQGSRMIEMLEQSSPRAGTWKDVLLRGLGRA